MNSCGDHEFIRIGLGSHCPNILNLQQLVPAKSWAAEPRIALNHLVLFFPGVSACLPAAPLGFDHTECVHLIKISLKTEAVENMWKMLGTQLANAEPQVKLNLKKNRFKSTENIYTRVSTSVS